jgi:hypothetical protein
MLHSHSLIQAVENLSSSEDLKEEVTTIEKHTKLNYTKEEYIESSVRETREYHQVQSSIDQFLVNENVKIDRTFLLNEFIIVGYGKRSYESIHHIERT